MLLAKQIVIHGPEAGYTVKIGGAPVYSTWQGPSEIPMPDTPHVQQQGDGEWQHGWIDSAGNAEYWVHVPDGPVQLSVEVTALDGTILLNRTINTLPVKVDAIGRNIFPGDPSQSAFEI